MKLYEIAGELETINRELDESGGELTPFLEQKIDSLQLALQVKGENIGKWVKNIDTWEDGIDAEIEKLRAKKRSAGNLKERLKSYLKVCMETAGVQKVESPAATARIQKNPPSLDITDQDKIPAKFLIVKYDIDKKALLDALKNGEIIAGAEIVTDRTHLRIS